MFALYRLACDSCLDLVALQKLWIYLTGHNLFITTPPLPRNKTRNCNVNGASKNPSVLLCFDGVANRSSLFITFLDRFCFRLSRDRLTSFLSLERQINKTQILNEARITMSESMLLLCDSAALRLIQQVIPSHARARPVFSRSSGKI